MKVLTVTTATKHQFDYVLFETADCWDLDRALAGVMIPALECLKRFKQGIPTTFFPPDYAAYGETIRSGQYAFAFMREHDELHQDAEEAAAVARWNAVLDQMIWAFRAVRENEYPAHRETRVREADGAVTVLDSERFNARVRLGLDAFARYYQHLNN